MHAPRKLAEPIRLYIRDVELVEARFEQGWPTFHDAEITRIALDRSGPTAHLVLAVPWRNSLCEVQILCEYIEDLELNGFNHQNVLGAIVLSLSEDGKLRLELHGLYGMTGYIVCKSLRVLNVSELRR